MNHIDIAEKETYPFEELSEDAKENARDWYIQTSNDIWEADVLKDFKEICDKIGITLKTSGPPPHRDDLHVAFKYSDSQSDGASFEGTYEYAEGATKAIRAHAPQEPELHRIADTLKAIQKRNFFQIRAKIWKKTDRSVHWNTMIADVERDSPNGQQPTHDARSIVEEAMRGLARWLYRELQRRYEDETGDSAVDANIAANQWMFTRAGELGQCHPS